MLMALGVNVEITPEHVGQCIDDVGIGFLFAPMLHGAMKYAIGPRREIGIRTIFNTIAPLTNPAGAGAHVLGVYAPELTETHAHALGSFGCKHAFVAHGNDGLDEITTTTTTRVSELVDGDVRTYTLDPTELGIPKAQPEDLVSGTPEENADTVVRLLNGERGPLRDIVALNAAAAIVAGGKAADLEEGLTLAIDSIDSGKALEKLEGLKVQSRMRNTEIFREGCRMHDYAQQTYTVADYCQAMSRHREIIVNRDYQRSDKVWPPAAKSFLIETILLNYPIPKLFLFQKTDLRSRRDF